MAGLLDGLVGDDTVKDDYGQTQADRRDPIWSGLIRAGLLAVAGGGKLMPEQRAQYLAQAGGALADIPKDMQNAAAASAQQKLRGQQLDEGKRKVADRDRIRAMMQAPEIADIVNNATGADKIAIQAAIQTGDIGALNAAIGNLDKSGINAERLNIAREKLELAKTKAEGTFQGSGMDPQAMNVLMAGKADSKEYYLAYNHLSKARTTIDPQSGQTVTVQPMDLRRFPQPTWGAPDASQTPTPTPQPNPDGTTPAPAAPAPPGSPTVTTGAPVVQKPLDPAALRKLQDEQVTLGKVTDAGQTFLSEWKKASVGDRVKSLSGAATPLNAAWTVLAMHLKSEAMFNLGVITGPDMALLQSVIANPATLSSGLVSDAQVEQAVNRLIESGSKAVKHREELVKAGRPGASQQTSPAAPAAPKVKTYNPQTGEFE